MYDLDITKPFKVDKHSVIFTNPSSDFRHKLIDGGGITISNDGHDDRSQSDRSRTQVSSSTSGSGKKHKGKTDEPKPSNAYENLFGPTQNVTAKHSPATNSNDAPKPQVNF